MKIAYANTVFMPLKCHPSRLGHGWDMVDGRCRLVHHTQPALPVYLPAPRLAEDSGSEDEEGDDGVQRRRKNLSEDSSESDSSETECSDLY